MCVVVLLYLALIYLSFSFSVKRVCVNFVLVEKEKCVCRVLVIVVCVFQLAGYGSSVTSVDAGLLSTLLPAQSSLSWFLKTADGNNVTGIAVILPYTNTG